MDDEVFGVGWRESMLWSFFLFLFFCLSFSFFRSPPLQKVSLPDWSPPPTSARNGHL
jgi:hypothetical protein